VTSIDAVRATIRRAAQDCTNALHGAETVGSEVREALSLAENTTSGSQHPKVKEGLARLAEAHRETELVARLLRKGMDAAQRYQRGLG
jgi:hypothetical protein